MRGRTRGLRAVALVVVAVLVLGVTAVSAEADGTPVVRLVYFSARDCSHCIAVSNDVLEPLQAEYGDGLQIKLVEVSEPSNYELLLRAEEMFGVGPEERGLPTLIIDGEVLIGEQAIRERLPCIVEACAAQAGTTWPDLPGLDTITLYRAAEPSLGLSLQATEGASCNAGGVAACEAPTAVWAAYFYDVGCQDCSRAQYDIEFVKSRYPQLVIEEYNVQEDAPLAEWLGARAGLPEGQRLASPCVFIGADALCGAALTSESLLALVDDYAGKGAPRVWADFTPEQARQSIIERFQSFGALAVAAAGLVDGLNPCAFATLIFFVSYLSLSGRRGREVLAVGAAFTVGVFLAYLAVGFGFYRVLDLLGGLLTTLGRWVYGLTALLCAALAVLSLIDAIKAHRGEMGDMTLSLPHKLRMRINSVIRQGRKSQTFVVGAFVTGLVVSLLELACTGQVYLPTIVFVVSQPALRVRAVGFLLLYNGLFIAPLVVVFILAYYGTGSQQLARFLERRASVVKVGMALLFAILAVWLGMSVAGVA
jgi:cytochrome c biogenesis protein CcdA/glutaredoxin